MSKKKCKVPLHIPDWKFKKRMSNPVLSCIYAPSCLASKDRSSLLVRLVLLVLSDFVLQGAVFSWDILSIGGGKNCFHRPAMTA